MDEDSDHTDISAAALAAICSKGQFSRSISLALSADASEATTCATAGRAASRDVGDEGDGRRKEGIEDGDGADELDDSSDSCTDEESSPQSEEDWIAVGEVPLPQEAPPQHRRRTKRQRQRAREQRLEFLAPFMRDDDDSEPGEVCGLVKGEDRAQRVPSLMELCLRRGFTNVPALPPGLKPLLSHQRTKTRLAALQLRWLELNMTLQEKLIKLDLVEALKPHGVKTSLLKRDARSLWRSNWWTRGTGRKRENHPEECQWILPVSVQTYHAVDWNIATLAHYINLILPHYMSDSPSTSLATSPGQGKGRCGDREVRQVKNHLSRRYPKLVRHCFDHAMAYVWWARGRCTLAQDAFKRVLQEYPADLTDKKSEKESCSVWARHKAMALAEVGRLMTSFDRPDSAGLFYRRAVEEASRAVHPDKVAKLTLQSLALSASAYDQGVMDRHSARKASQLWLAAHKQAVSMGDPPLPNYPQSDHYIEKGTRDVLRAAVESLVHCHAGVLMTASGSGQGSPAGPESNRAWLRETRATLESLREERWAYVGLYLSLILAMLNEGLAAEDAFNLSLQSFRSVPGNVARQPSLDDIKPHPWWVFEEWIKARATTRRRVPEYPLQVLPLVWRRGIGHPSYGQDRSTRVSCQQVAEIQGAHLKFHLTPEGYLSATMTQNLPPLQTVCFDPLTGKLILEGSRCESVQQQWDNYDQHNLQIHQNSIKADDRFTHNSALPQPNVIYADAKTSAQVSLLTVGIGSFYVERACDEDERQRRTATANRSREEAGQSIDRIHRQIRLTLSALYKERGRTVRLDVVQLVVQELKKYIMNHLRIMYEDKAVSKGQDLIDYCMKRHYGFTLWSVKAYIRDSMKDSPEKEESARQGTNKEDLCAQFFKRAAQHKSPYMTVILKDVLYLGKATTVLHLHLTTFDAFVFLDCSSAARFGQAVVRLSCLEDTEFPDRATFYASRWVLPDDGRKAEGTTAKMLLAFANDMTSINCSTKWFSHTNLHVYNEQGSSLHYECPPDLESRFFKICCGNKLIGTTSNHRRVIVCDLPLNAEKRSEELPQVQKMAVACDTLFLLTAGGALALDLNTLQPLVTVVLNDSRYVSVSNDSGLIMGQEMTGTGHLELFCPHEARGSGDAAPLYCKAFLALDNHVLLVQRRKPQEGQGVYMGQAPNVLEIVDVVIPGRPTELCYISPQDGFVVSATIFTDPTDPHYRENLYWFDMSGALIAMHPFLGGGHHGFAPVYLQDPNAKADTSSEKGLYLYFADGLGSVCCIKLDRSLYK